MYLWDLELVKWLRTMDLGMHSKFLKCKTFALAFRSQLGVVTKRLVGTSS